MKDLRFDPECPPPLEGHVCDEALRAGQLVLQAERLVVQAQSLLAFVEDCRSVFLLAEFPQWSRAPDSRRLVTQEEYIERLRLRHPATPRLVARGVTPLVSG